MVANEALFLGEQMQSCFRNKTRNPKSWFLWSRMQDIRVFGIDNTVSGIFSSQRDTISQIKFY